MYRLKQDMKKDLKNRYKEDEIASQVHMSRGFVSEILNGHKCTYVSAYVLVKNRDLQANVEDYFDII